MWRNKVRQDDIDVGAAAFCGGEQAQPIVELPGIWSKLSVDYRELIIEANSGRLHRVPRGDRRHGAARVA